MATTETTRSIPEWMQQAGQENYALSKSITGGAYTPYSEARIAPQTADQTASYGKVREGVGSQNPFLSQASGLTTGATQKYGGSYKPETVSPNLVGKTDLSSYLNPYTSEVIDRSATEMRRGGEIERLGIRNAATSAGAYNTDRHGIVEAEQRRNMNKLISDMTASMFERNFLNAQGVAAGDRDAAMSADLFNTGMGAQAFGLNTGQFNTEADRALRGAGDLVNLAGAEKRLGLQDAASLAAIGEEQQGQGQSSLDLAYSDFLRQKANPFEMLNYRIGTLEGTPYEGRTITESTDPKSNTGAQALGTAATLAALFAMS